MANPLESKRRAAAATGEHPMMSHAKTWQHVNSMHPDDMASKADELSYSLPVIGALASNPKVTRKDVIKAAADASGAGKIPASQAVAVISQMPTDPEKVQPWLRGMYEANLSALVHIKAALMPAAPQSAPQPGAPQ